MSRIRILSDRVANQIAAGEVIERPVAVVKELLENSLDAGAKRIEIEFRNGGKRYIRVEDDGYGMSPDEALLSLERHATSKIRAAQDLDSVRTFGFRGEALPSIASVCHFTMKTRMEQSEAGCEVRVSGGKIIHQKACGMPVGTRIEVEHLFFPVPARRKFLKTDQTESAHIVQMTRWFAVAHPECAFTLIENGRVIFQSPPCNSTRERVEEIWGKAVAENLLDFQFSDEKLKIHGLIGAPGFSRSTRQELVCLVNRRPVESRTLNYAIIEAYHTSIPRGRYPVVFLLFDVDPGRIDVNVHPTKREIRFREESQVRHRVLNSILERLRREKEGALRSAPVNNKGGEAETMPRLPGKNNGAESEDPQGPVRSPSRPASPPSEAETPRPDPVSPEPQREKPHLPGRSGSQLNWRYLGRMVHGLILFETGKGLVLLDPDAAHRRIRYETVREYFRSEVSARQPLLLPLSLELEPLSASCLEDNLDFLNRNGFEIERFGRNFYRVLALPPWLDPGEGENYLRDLIDQVRQQGLNLNLEKPDLAHYALAKLAVGNESGNKSRAENPSRAMQIAESLLQCKDPYTEPGGKTTFVELSRGELDRRFGK